MEDYVELADRNLERADQILKDLQVQEIWDAHRSKANLIGSVKTRLLMLSRDIDFHVYSEGFSISNSFSAISEIAKNRNIKRLSFYNFLDTDDKSLDWHLHYNDKDGNDWRIDIINLRKDSPFVGKAEKVADDINRLMDEKTRRTILKIKYDAAKREMDFHGIEVYKAVIEAGIHTIDDFVIWKNNERAEERNMWEIVRN